MQKMICLLFGQYWEKLGNFLFHHLVTQNVFPSSVSFVIFDESISKNNLRKSFFS